MKDYQTLFLHLIVFQKWKDVEYPTPPTTSLFDLMSCTLPSLPYYETLHSASTSSPLTRNLLLSSLHINISALTSIPGSGSVILPRIFSGETRTDKFLSPWEEHNLFLHIISSFPDHTSFPPMAPFFRWRPLLSPWRAGRGWSVFISAHKFFNHMKGFPSLDPHQYSL